MSDSELRNMEIDLGSLLSISFSSPLSALVCVPWCPDFSLPYHIAVLHQRRTLSKKSTGHRKVKSAQTSGAQMVPGNRYILCKNFWVHLYIDDAIGEWYSGTIPRAAGSRGLPAGAVTSG